MSTLIVLAIYIVCSIVSALVMYIILYLDRDIVFSKGRVMFKPHRRNEVTGKSESGERDTIMVIATVLSPVTFLLLLGTYLVWVFKWWAQALANELSVDSKDENN